MHVKKGDEVLVITGKEKGKKGKITLSIPAKNRVVVEGLNKIKRHVRPRAT
jgi:large subunit ribosomal protein L24